MRRTVMTFAAMVGLHLLVAGTAWAHGPTLQANAVCLPDGTRTLLYTSTSWSAYAGEGENPQIDVYVNGVVVATGAYVFPDNKFSGSVAAPGGISATMTAAAVGTWGDGAPGGQNEHITVDLSTTACPPAAGTGRFTGGGSQIRLDSVRVTRGLTVHCDLLLSNNLEINWSGNQFHMTEHLTTVRCSDSPEIVQAPPAAPLDTMVGIGTGRYNGVANYTVEFTFVDYGEPGGSDRAALKIYNAATGVVVLDIPLQLLAGGNLQAHYDQPHK